MSEGCLDDDAVARFAAGRCSPEEDAAFREHLSGCARCTLRVTQASGPSDPATVPVPMDQGASSRPERATDAGTNAIKELKGRELLGKLGRGALLGRYLILHRVGEGGMGVVYAAYDPELDRKVAVKLLRAKHGQSSTDTQGGQARLLREAQAMARVSHPNVMNVFDVGMWEDRVFVAMEYVEGVTLKKWQEQPRTPQQLVEMYVGAGQGLAAAHAAGLVHRDFKPDNVLIGADGRARVTDFGLARMVSQTDSQEGSQVGPAPGSAPASEPPRRMDDAITQDGTVIGTPQYMAPEQHLGLPPDARSDQFSFCAALYYALYRKHAFTPDKLAAAARESHQESGTAVSTRALRAAALKGRPTVILEPPREPKVPPWVRRTIVRGLALAPQDRFPTMADLLAELSRQPPTTAWKGWAAAALGLGLTVSAVFGYGELTRFRVIRASEARLSGVWDVDTQSAVEKAFISTGKPYAGATWAGVKTVLDGYSRAWVAASVETAHATRRGEQTEQVLALRRVCLDRRLKEMKALTAVLSTADSKTVEKAIDAVHALPDLKRCSDTEALTTPVAPPGDERTRAAIDRIASSLAEAKALYDAGKFKQGLDVAQVAANEARALGYRPLQAEALYMLGRFQARTGATGAENTLAEAVWAAEAGRQDETKVLATSELVYFVGYQQGRFDDNHHWERLGTAALERLGPGHDALEAELLTSMGSVYLLAGRNAMAQGPLERALQLIGRHHPKRASVLTTLGALYGRQGKSQHARNVLEEAVSVIESSRGPEHPVAAYPHNNLADALMEDGEYEKALVHVQKALAIWASSLGPEHHIVGDGEDHLATILGAQGRHSESLQHYVRALEIKEKKLGAEHPDLAYSLDGIGQAYVGMGRPQEALPYLERALELRKHDAGGLADTRFNLARALWEAHQDRDRALSLATQAKQGFLASGNKKDADRVETWLAASRP